MTFRLRESFRRLWGTFHRDARAQAEVATNCSRAIQAEAEHSRGNEFQRQQILAQRMSLEVPALDYRGMAVIS
jgi:hypothetical protein